MDLKEQEKKYLEQVTEQLNQLSNEYGLDFTKINVSRNDINQNCRYVVEHYKYRGKAKVRIVYKCDD